MSVNYSMAQPQNTKENYDEFDQVDFVVSFQGRDVVANSFRLLGNLSITNNGRTEKVLVDEFVGAHSFIDEILTSSDNLGLIETYQNYARYVSMVGRATLNKDDLNSSRHVCELKATRPDVVECMLKTATVKPDSNANSGSATLNPDFSIKPVFCLNNVEGDQRLSYSKYGDIKISFRLRRYVEALYGEDAKNATYSLSDVRLTYLTVPEGPVAKNILRKKVTFSQSVQNNFTSIASKVPAVCSGVSISFIEQSRVGEAVDNNDQQMQLPDVTSLQFLFNDSENRYITYEIKDNVEMIHRYLESFKKVEKDQASLEYLAANQSYGLGLSFDKLIDLSNQKFTVQINSSVNSGNPYVAYLYFHGVMEV